MTLPTFTLRQMIEAGVHFGHHARRWNPKMAPYIFGKKDNVHIIDLQKTYPMLYTAMATTKEIAAQGGKVLFVATKKQAQEIVKEHAERCGQYYVNYRWLGGMLTNWKTVYKSINHLVKLNDMFAKNETEGYTKKELLNLKKELETGLKISDLEMDKYLLEITKLTNQEEIDKLNKKTEKKTSTKKSTRPRKTKRKIDSDIIGGIDFD